MLKFHRLELLISAIWRGFQTTVISLHSTSRTNPVTYRDKTGLNRSEEDDSKTTAHRRGIAYRIRQETLPTGGKCNLQ